jgi:hypothetical protein
MGREIRMIKPGWEHPKYPDDHYESHRRGRYIPLYRGGFVARDAEWNEEYAKWQEGFVRSYAAGETWRPREPGDGPRYTDYAGSRPSPDDFMPDWPEGEATLLVMYEDTSEGTPISPGFETPEELARWLADNGASSFGDMTATYEQWLSMAKRGWAPSMVLSSAGMESGVAALAEPRSSEAAQVVS